MREQLESVTENASIRNPRKAVTGNTAAWQTVGGAAIYSGLSIGPLALYTFGVFVPSILSDTQWSKEAVAGSIGPATLLLAIGQPVSGFLADKFGVRRVALAITPLFAFCLVSLGLFSHSPGTFAILLAVLFAVGAGVAPPPFVQAVSSWFDRSRGLALSIVFAGGSVGIALLPPLSGALISHWGWRMTYVWLGILVFAALMPCAVYMLKSPPRIVGGVKTERQNGLTVLETLRTGRFWIIFVSFSILTAAVTGAAVNLPVGLSSRNVAMEQAALIMTVVGITNFIGRLAMGVLLDRFFAPWLTAVTWFAPFAAYLILAGSDTEGGLILAAALLGFGLGCETDALAYIAGRAFGLRQIGAVYGVVFMAYGTGAAIGPALVGITLQRKIDPGILFPLAAAAIALAAILLASLRPRHLPFGVQSRA